jgi:hypothetical protein
MSFPRDNHLVDNHVQNLDSFGEPLSHCVYNAIGAEEEKFNIQSYVVQCQEAYVDLPLKLYGILKHALEYDWERLLKTDVNVTVVKIDWHRIFASELAGVVVYSRPRLSDVSDHFYPPLLRDASYMSYPIQWVAGSAYSVSRHLAQLIVARGPWEARRYYAEDVYVSQVAKQHGIMPVPAIAYVGDTGELEVNE